MEVICFRMTQYPHLEGFSKPENSDRIGGRISTSTKYLKMQSFPHPKTIHSETENVRIDIMRNRDVTQCEKEMGRRENNLVFFILCNCTQIGLWRWMRHWVRIQNLHDSLSEMIDNLWINTRWMDTIAGGKAHSKVPKRQSIPKAKKDSLRPLEVFEILDVVWTTDSDWFF
jgi:hypothetical protein